MVYPPPYQHLLTNINPHTREHYITPILTIMRKYLKFRILAGVGHNHHPTAAVPYHRGYTPPICLILNTFCGLRFCAYFFTIYVIYSSVWSRVRSLYRVICVGGNGNLLICGCIYGASKGTAQVSVSNLTSLLSADVMK